MPTDGRWALVTVSGIVQMTTEERHGKVFSMMDDKGRRHQNQNYISFKKIKILFGCDLKTLIT